MFLMIGRLAKFDALCRCIVADRDGDDGCAGGWNEGTPCAVIQNAGGGEGGGRIDVVVVARPEGVEVVAGGHSEGHQG